jgi:hypothetical protein
MPPGIYCGGEALGVRQLAAAFAETINTGKKAKAAASCRTPRASPSLEKVCGQDRARRCPVNLHSDSLWSLNRFSTGSMDSLEALRLGNFRQARDALPEKRLELIPGGCRNLQSFLVGQIFRKNDGCQVRDTRISIRLECKQKLPAAIWNSA